MKIDNLFKHYAFIFGKSAKDIVYDTKLSERTVRYTVFNSNGKKCSRLTASKIRKYLNIPIEEFERWWNN